MPLLLTILSVLAVWAFLLVLVIGLLLIFKPLQSVKVRLEQITAGVRAIEQETKPLNKRSDQLVQLLQEAARLGGKLADQQSAVSKRFSSAASAFRSKM